MTHTSFASRSPRRERREIARQPLRPGCTASRRRRASSAETPLSQKIGQGAPAPRPAGGSQTDERAVPLPACASGAPARSAPCRPSPWSTSVARCSRDERDANGAPTPPPASSDHPSIRARNGRKSSSKSTRHAFPAGEARASSPCASLHPFKMVAHQRLEVPGRTGCLPRLVRKERRPAGALEERAAVLQVPLQGLGDQVR